MGPGLIQRYRAFLPVTDRTPDLSLGEGATPLIRLRHIGRELGLPNLWTQILTCASS